MGWKLDLVLWLGKKLKVNLENYFRPSDSEELVELIDELRQDGEESMDRLAYLQELARVMDLEEELNDEYDSNPVEAIYQLEDQKGLFYIWKLPSEWSDQKRDNLFARLVSSFREKYNRDPEANHLLLTEVEAVQDVSREEMKDLLGFAADDL